MNKQVSSHWRLVWKAFKKDLEVTVSLIGRSLRANLYIQKVYRHLERQRELFAMIPDNENQEEG